MDKKEVQAFLRQYFPASFFIGWLLSFAVARCMQVCFNVPGGFLVPLLYTGLLTVFMSFLLRSRLFRFISLIAIGAGLLVIIFYKNGAVFPFLKDFFNWLMQLSLNLTTPEAGWPALAVALFSLAAIPISLVSVRWVFLPGQLSLYIGFFLWMWLNSGNRSLLYAAIGMVAIAGGFALSFGQQNVKKKATPDREYFTLLWVIPTMAIFSLALWASMSNREAFARSRWLADRMEVVQTLISDRTGLMQRQESFSLKQTGYAPLGTTQLGGKVTHLSKLEVMKVQSDAPGLYLRGTVSDKYTGTAWTKSEAKYLMRTDMEAFAQTLATSFDGQLLDEVNHPEWFYKKVRISVYPEDTLKTTTVFTPIRLDSVRTVYPLSMLIYFSEYGELYGSRKVKDGMDYQIEATLPDTSNSSFGNAVRKYQLTHVLPGSDAYAAYEQVLATHSELPETVPDSLYALAEEITGSYTGDYGLEAAIADTGVVIDDTSYLTAYSRAKAIEYWLAVNCTYTTEPENTPEDTDFVANFLETREGYCTYYASAMAVLARAAGLPARYVEGFKLPDYRTHSGMYTLKMTDSHAWCEVYIAGIGWLVFDPLAVELPKEPTETTSATYVEPTLAPWELQTNTPMPMATQEGMVIEEVEQDYTWLIITITALLAAGGITLLIIMVLLKTKEKRAYYRTNRGRIHKYYKEIMRLLSYYNAPIQPGETLFAFALRIDKWLYLPDRMKFVDIADLITRISYARWNPSKADIRTMRTFARALRTQAVRDTGIFFYFTHHILRIPYRRPEDT